MLRRIKKELLNHSNQDSKPLYHCSYMKMSKVQLRITLDSHQE